MIETEVIADEGPCACDPANHRVHDTRKNETGSITRRRYKCLFCLKRWTMYDLTVSEMERLRKVESGVTALLKAIGK